MWVSQPSAGLDKRQATLQLCIRATGVKNIKPALVFRGKGNVYNEEKKSMTKELMRIFSQMRGWTKKINMQWMKNILIPGIGDDKEEKVLFADSVSFQQSQKFYETCRDEINTTVYMRTIRTKFKFDAGCGRIVKFIGEALER